MASFNGLYGFGARWRMRNLSYRRTARPVIDCQRSSEYQGDLGTRGSHLERASSSVAHSFETFY